MYEQHLQQVGLTSDQAIIYETLVKEGPLLASDIAYKSKVGRTLTYKVLKELEGLELVLKDTIDGSVAIFTAAHPTKLEELLTVKEKGLKNAQAALSGIMDTLVSDFNLVIGKPNVRFFEGNDGIQAILNDSLNSNEEIRAYSDIATIQKYGRAMSNDYIKSREKMSVRRRSIMPDTPENRTLVSKNYTGKLAKLSETRFIGGDKTPFETYMQIYDGKISYIAFSKDDLVGTIIDDQRIYQLHKTLFDHLWSITPQAV